MSAVILSKFTTHLRESLKNSLKIAVDLRHKKITPLHLLYGLISQKGAVGAEILTKNGLTKEMITPFLINLDRKTEKNEKNAPGLDEESGKILAKSAALSAAGQHRYVGTEHLLCAILEKQDPSIEFFWIKQNINKISLKKNAQNVLQSVNRFPEIASFSDIPPAGRNQSSETKTRSKTKTKKIPALNFFALELTGAKEREKIDPIIGREKEIGRLTHILCRRAKNNPVLLGDPGVGKTAIVEGLAQKINRGEVPGELQNKRLWQVDLGLMVAGTIYRGEFENRLKQLLDEARENPEIILFIDEIHTIVGAGSASGSLDAANILKPALSRGEVRCIGATTFEEYKKHIESDAALERRFQPIVVEEPSRGETIEILNGLKENYEKYHLIKISDEAVTAAVDLSTRHRQDRFLPDKAIDLLDEAAAAKKLEGGALSEGRRIKSWEKEISRIRIEKERAVAEENFEKALELKENESEILKKINECEQKIRRKTKRPDISLSAEDVAKIISLSTGRPVGELMAEEKNILAGMEEEIKKKIVGQDQAVSAIAKALRRARLGLNPPNRPLASFLLAGPSGVGKTALAKTLAELIFKNPDALVRIDMSEFAEGFQVSKLIGSPAGYVGYKEGNKFTDRVKARPYSVILFDEIDKAHPEALNILLQILDEGHLTDAAGKKINFKNTVILMTTNLGQEHFSAGGLGFDERKKEKFDEKKIQSAGNSVMEELKNKFRADFLNRLDSVLIFRPLDSSDLEKIAELKIAELNERLAEKKINLILEPEARRRLAEKATEMEQGARGVSKIIRSEIEEPLAEILLGKNEKSAEKKIKIRLTKNKIGLFF